MHFSQDNNVAYSKPLDFLLPHVLHPFKIGENSRYLNGRGAEPH